MNPLPSRESEPLSADERRVLGCLTGGSELARHIAGRRFDLLDYDVFDDHVSDTTGILRRLKTRGLVANYDGRTRKFWHLTAEGRDAIEGGA